MIISSKTDEFQVGCVINLSATKPYGETYIYTGCGVKVALHFWEVAEPFKSDILYHRLARPQCALRERMDSSAKLPPAHTRYVACHLSSQYNTKKTKVSSI